MPILDSLFCFVYIDSLHGRGIPPLFCFVLVAVFFSQKIKRKEVEIIEITKELWYGNIVPQTDCRPQTEEFKQLTEYILRHKSDLTISLSKEQLEVFDKLETCVTEYISISEAELFTYAYHLGMRTTMEALHNKFNLE